jgi:hypothetical protein
MFALMPWRKSKMALLPRTETPLGWMPEEFTKLFNRFFPTWPVMETPEWEYPWCSRRPEHGRQALAAAKMVGRGARVARTQHGDKRCSGQRLNR